MDGQKINMSFDDYEEICRFGETIVSHDIPVPSKEEAKSLTRETSFKYFLSYLIILEECSTPRTEEEKKIISYLGKVIKNRVVFTETDSEKQKDKIILTEKEACFVETALKKCTFHNDVYFSKNNVTKLFQAYPEWSFSIAYMLVRKGTETAPLKNLASIIKEKVRIINDPDVLEIPEAKYNQVVSALDSSNICWDKWLPKKSFIEKILIPNIDKTYDYLIWISLKCKDNEEYTEYGEYIKNVLNHHIKFPDSRVLTGFLAEMKEEAAN